MTAEHPFVSVIVPAFNDATALTGTLAALREQTYPAERFEVIVVDNGSTDQTVAVASAHAEVKLLYEHEHKGSPYSCRNRGLEVARGDIVAFLDATCEPEPHWLSEAVAAFKKTDADLVGGRVEFKFAGQTPSIGEYYDSVTNIQMERSILERQHAKTANLCVRRSVVQNVGPFPEGIRSGGDVRWTGRATKAGHRLVYCASALVHKPARHALALLKKQWRVSKAKPAIWAEGGTPFPLRWTIISFFFPPKPTISRKLWNRSPPTQYRPSVLKFWLMHYAVAVVSRAAYLWGWLQLKRKSNQRE